MVTAVQATAAAEDAVEAHKLLKSRGEALDGELFAANSKVQQLSAALLQAQQQAAEAAERAAEAEEQSKQVGGGNAGWGLAAWVLWNGVVYRSGVKMFCSAC